MDILSHVTGLELVGFFNAGLNPLPIIPYTLRPGMELVELLTGGKVFFEQDGRRLTLGRGTIFWHIPGDSTIWDTPPEAPYKCAVFRFFVREKRRLMPRVSFWRGSDSSLEEFLKFSRSWFDNTPEDPRLFAWCAATLSAHASAPDCFGVRRDLLSHASPEDPFARLIAYIEKNPAASPDVDTLCRISGLSRNRLFKEFRLHFNMTPHACVTAKRIERAKNPLENTTMPIKEIAGACGFDNIEVFYRTFRKAAGVTPGEYRNACASYFFPDKNI